MPNLLILSYFFPPLNDIAARRFGTMVGYLNKSGFHVNVLTTHSHGTLPLDIAEEQVIRIGNNERQSASLDDQAADKLPLFIDIIRQPARQKGFYLWSVDRTVTTWYQEIKANLPYIDSHIQKPDLIIGSFGPSASLWGARFLSRYYGKPWIADIRDLGALRNDDRNFLAKFIDVNIEKRLLASAAALTTVSHTLKEILARQNPQEVEVIYNGWDKALNNISNAGSKNPKYIYYAGSFYYEQIPALLMLLDSLVDFPGLFLLIRSLGPIDINHQILMYAEQQGLSDRISILPPCDPEMVNQEAEQSCANLVLNDLSMQTYWTRGTLTGKLFELLVHTPPILAVGRPDGEMGEILRQTSKGTLCSNSNEIYAFLAQIYQGAASYNGDSGQIAEFSRERQAAKLGKFIRRFLF